jgi:hypothetical protein
VKVDGRTLAAAIHRVYDNNDGGMRTEGRAALGIR